MDQPTVRLAFLLSGCSWHTTRAVTPMFEQGLVATIAERRASILLVATLSDPPLSARIQLRVRAADAVCPLKAS
jgi:hypothetical protein